MIASTLATSVRAVLLGQQSMFTMGNADFDVLHGLPFYLLLGVICGSRPSASRSCCIGWRISSTGCRIDDLWHPAIGALASGSSDIFVPRVLGVGYDTISDILNNNLALKLLILDRRFQGAARW